MSRILVYTSGSISDISGKVTGGTKRFNALARYLYKHRRADICSMDSEEDLNKIGLSNTWHLEKADKSIFGLFPPELCIAYKNRKVLTAIKNYNYEKVVVFDVPPAVCLSIMGIKNLALMLRKDAVEYERIISKRKFSFKIMYIWMSEVICILNSKQIIVQCSYDKNNLKKRHPLLRNIIDSITKVQINNVNPPWAKDVMINNRRSESDFKVCYIGGFDDSRKGQDVLLKASEIVHEIDKSISFEIVGGGINFDSYKERYSSAWVRFHGRLSDPLDVLLMCNLLVVPSLADSCPNTVSEGINCSVPVIGSNRGGIPELLDDKEALFDIDEEKLAQLIVKCKKDKNFYNKLARNQAERKKQLTFNWEERISTIIE